MATVITEECINCGACEPECPNTAIYQGGVEYQWQDAMHGALSDDFFYIVPEKCTECVGFFDQEACAAVCPVDCCIPDPDRPESEEVLLQRAKELHPDAQFGDDFPSRFKEGAGGDAAPAPAAPAQDAPAAPAAASPSPPPPASAPVAQAAPSVASIEDFEVPVPCRTCGATYGVAYRFLTPGTVLRCPTCQESFSPSQRMYISVGQRLEKYAQEMNAEIDRHDDLLSTEKRRFETNTGRILDEASDDVSDIVDRLTEVPKKSMFG